MTPTFTIKVCGMRDKSNILELCSGGVVDVGTPVQITGSAPNYMGFIFAEQSPRFVGTAFSPDDGVRLLPEYVHAVCVVVNAEIESICALVERYAFYAVQLHGSESPAFCSALQAVLPKDVQVWKARSIATVQDVERSADYDGVTDRLLFDTKGAAHGGNGMRFDWSLLERYTGETPWFVSGGIGAEHVDDIVHLAQQHERLCGVDVNSRFETAPALKNVAAVQTFIAALRQKLLPTMG
jgi:phosphoribosylanthranilate isomerase